MASWTSPTADHATQDTIERTHLRALWVTTPFDRQRRAGRALNVTCSSVSSLSSRLHERPPFPPPTRRHHSLGYETAARKEYC